MPKRNFEELANKVSAVRHDLFGQLQGIEGAVGGLQSGLEVFQKTGRLPITLGKLPPNLAHYYGVAIVDALERTSKLAEHSFGLIAASKVMQSLGTNSDHNKFVGHNVRQARLIRAKLAATLVELDKNKDALPPERYARLQKFIKVGCHLADSIARLDFSLVPARQKLDVGQILRESSPGTDYVDRHGRQVRLRLLAGRGLRVKADPNFMARIVNNLYQDAAIHPRPSSRLRVVVTAQKEGDDVKVRFVSHGCGPIPTGVAKQIGARVFSTRDGAANDEHGFGKINSRELVEAMGGSFRAFNFKNRHPALEFTLPAA